MRLTRRHVGARRVIVVSIIGPAPIWLSVGLLALILAYPVADALARRLPARWQ